MSGIARWLDGLGLGQYASLFAENAIDEEVLPELTEDHLKELGMPLGHRLRIIKAITASARKPPAASGSVASSITETTSDARSPSEAERRQLSVMFCDLVGSTALAERFDPEELRELLAQYQDTCAAIIERFDGYIARYVGDALLVYFGYPQAHEDDAQRSVRAALDIVDAIRKLNEEPSKPGRNLAVRIGITTGLVVAGDIGSGERHEEMAIVGETPNVAARLQGIAQPNTVVIGAGTYRLVEGLFECHELGPQRLKNVSEPVSAYLVQREGRALGRFEARASRGLLPLIGRQEEISLLQKRWTQATEGESQVVMLSGEAGIGKSRILRALQEPLEDEACSRILYYCSAYHQNSALYPAIDQLERGLRFEETDDPARKLDKLAAVLRHLGLSTDEFVPPLASLLGLPIGESYSPLDFGSDQPKKKTLEALVMVIEAMASRTPVLMVVEDVHWGDPSTLELMELLIEQLRSARFLLIIVYRPEFAVPWGSHTHVTALTLNRLTRKDSAAMISNVAGHKPLPEEIVDQIVARTDGVPLFVEELTKTMLESNLLEDTGERYVLTGPLPPLAIPESLQDSLMARLDRLAPAKEIAQLAATMGRTFSHELIAAVSSLDEEALEEALAQLVNTELIYRRGAPPHARYEFKHALVQEAAYQSLLKGIRQQYHQKIAHVLEEKFPHVTESEPELLAHHFTEAQLTEKAISYWQRAGDQARERSANLEAIAHLTKGRDMLMTLPDSLERTRQELDLQMALGPALMAAKGFAAPEVERTYSRARLLCQQVGDTPQLFQALWGLTRFHQVRVQLREARELSSELLLTAQRLDDPELLLGAHLSMGAALLWSGEFAATRPHFERAIDLYKPQQHRVLTARYGEDPGVVARLRHSYGLWMLGYPEQALNCNREAIALARDLSDAFSLTRALIYGSFVHVFRRDTSAVMECAEEGFSIASEKGFPQWLAWSRILRGWGNAQRSQFEDGIPQMQEGISIAIDVGTLGRPYFLSLLAEALWRSGRVEEALESLGVAESALGDTGEHFGESELHRIRGQVLAKQGSNDGEAEICFRRAMDLARRQQARSLELRAAISLAQFWCHRNNHDNARELLAPIYGWFTEGFETADLKEANALLEAPA